MEFTENFQFPCPDEEDYGASALYMQSLAKKIEAALIAQDARHDAFNAQPTAVWILSTDTSAISSTGVQGIGWSIFNSTVFRNYPGSPSIFASDGFPTPGIYHLGIYLNSTAVGATNADTFRQIVLRVRKNTSSGSVITAGFARRVQEESISGGNFFGLDATVVVEQDFFNYTFETEFTHGNTSSDMIVESGATVWFTRIGFNEVIEVS